MYMKEAEKKFAKKNIQHFVFDLGGMLCYSPQMFQGLSDRQEIKCQGPSEKVFALLSQ